MNTHPSYTLASRPQTGRFLRARAVILRGTFATTIFLTDVAFIVAMSCLTGIAYHLAVYGKPGNISSFVQVGVLAASIFAVSTCSAANTGCRISAPSSRMAATPSICGT
jgi:hypothetical protein